MGNENNRNEDQLYLIEVLIRFGESWFNWHDIEANSYWFGRMKHVGILERADSDDNDDKYTNGVDRMNRLHYWRLTKQALDYIKGINYEATASNTDISNTAQQGYKQTRDTATSTTNWMD